MSIEYFTPVNPTEECVSAIVRQIGQSEDYEVTPQEGKLAVRVKSRPAMDRWPEDIEVRFDGGILVTFHSASRQERSTFLSQLEAILASCGYSADFEET